MKLNHKFALLLAGAVLAGSLTGCGASSAPASSATSSEAAASSAVSEAASEPTAETALPDGVYTADFDTDSSMFHANEANDGKGTLTVKDGQMTFHVSLASKKIVNLYVGMAADAEAHEGDWLQPTTDTVTYSDGTSDEVYGFDIPVKALDEDFQLAILGTKGKWYDHTVRVANAQPAAAEAPADGTYTCDVTLEVGSAAAPTAGLHFTKELLEKIREKGVNEAFVTLHVGLGTFRPVKAEEVTEHHMHSELCMMNAETAKILNETKRNGGRVICVGTTSCRTLESLVNDDGTFEAKSRWTDIFIYPGYTFKAMDGLITNFHLPESTLVMLVSAFAGREHVLNAYEEAVKQRYRFFSFGDAMCIV